MEMQTLIVALVVLAALVYMGRRAWRAIRGGAGKDGDDCGGSSCGCH